MFFCFFARSVWIDSMYSFGLYLKNKIYVCVVLSEFVPHGRYACIVKRPFVYSTTLSLSLSLSIPLLFQALSPLPSIMTYNLAFSCAIKPVENVDNLCASVFICVCACACWPRRNVNVVVRDAIHGTALSQSVLYCRKTLYQTLNSYQYRHY